MTREEVKALLKLKTSPKCAIGFLDGQFGEIVPNLNVADEPFAIVTNTKTRKD